MTAEAWSNQEHRLIKARFPGSHNVHYFDIAARGLISDAVKEAVDGFMETRISGGAPKSALWAVVDDARDRFARLIGAESDEIAITKNVSEGLNFFATSVTWKTGDNVVVCPGLEHSNNVVLWYVLRDRLGIEVREVAPLNGRLDVERMCTAIDESTRIVTMPSISFTPGFITDVGSIATVAREKGAYSLVDAAQSIGALHTDVRESGVDALVVATQKCILSLYGFGFLYVRREVAEGMIPASVGRYGIDLGSSHETDLTQGPIRFQPGARRFDLSNHNYLGATAAAAALTLLEEIDVNKVETHVRGLAAQLGGGLLDMGLPVVGGESALDRAHIVAVGNAIGRKDQAGNGHRDAQGGGGHGGGHGYKETEGQMTELYHHLVAHGVRLSIRRGTLRFSVGVYNDAEDVEAVLSLVRAWAR